MSFPPYRDQPHQTLLSPFTQSGLSLRNRFVMAPMTRSFSMNGLLDSRTPEYYARRAAGGVGLIITEALAVNEPSSAASGNVPRIGPPGWESNWREVANAVHSAGVMVIPQIWHVGMERDQAASPFPEAPNLSPSGMSPGRSKATPPMDEDDIARVITAFAGAAQQTQQLGFDGVEIHAAHGYLLDEFLWETTNQRSDRYGGSVQNRSRLTAEIIAAVRRATGPDYPIIVRVSQWKTADFTARPWPTAEHLEAALTPLADAGADLFHCSTRRFWEAEYEGSNLNLAGWVKKVTGKPTITVGSVGLRDNTFIDTLIKGEGAQLDDMGTLETMFAQDQFDLVAIGRALISDPGMVNKLRSGHLTERLPFDSADLATLD
ncbi:MAG: 12-oxophytodienoate reductase [Propionibacteriaceae bacterium]|nr:12-oxophytodienoate reductase [Propionibacteriaceae bacterium]